MKPILKKGARKSPSGCESLSALEDGANARLCDHHREGVSLRLRDLGFVSDTPIHVLRSAPLGDPVEIEIRGTRLCLRRADVAHVCVIRETERS